MKLRTFVLYCWDLRAHAIPSGSVHVCCRSKGIMKVFYLWAMLLKDFYTIRTLEQLDEQKYIAGITLNKQHDIFKGHFPDQPVTPGVCMMQIVKELSEQILERKLFMYKSSNVKFMALINPEVNTDLRLEIDILGSDASDYKVKNVTYFEDTVALKLTCTFRVR